MKFEDVLPRINMKSFKDMDEDELLQIVQDLRSIRTSVPETKQVRRKTRSKEYMAKQLAQAAKLLGKSAEELLADPELAKLLSS